MVAKLMLILLFLFLIFVKCIILPEIQLVLRFSFIHIQLPFSTQDSDLPKCLGRTTFSFFY